MTPALEVLGLWLLFFGSHVLLGADAVRARLSPRAHLALYVPVAWVTWVALCVGYASRRFSGDAGLALATHGVAPLLYGLSAIGTVLMAAGSVVYPRAPMRILRTETREATGLQRITRHPFFVGACLWGTAHALLALHATGMAFFGGLALQSGLGCLSQDAKLARRRGEPYRALVAATSVVPFVALLQGRQRLMRDELPGLAYVTAVGVLAAFALRYFHDALLGWNGWGLALFVVVGSSAISIGALRKKPVPEARVTTA